MIFPSFSASSDRAALPHYRNATSESIKCAKKQIPISSTILFGFSDGQVPVVSIMILMRKLLQCLGNLMGKLLQCLGGLKRKLLQWLRDDSAVIQAVCAVVGVIIAVLMIQSLKIAKEQMESSVEPRLEFSCEPLAFDLPGINKYKTSHKLLIRYPDSKCLGPRK
ncbi:MAG: hypothetical protein WCO56_01985 [Verrucomicrobiota bacterium]